MINVFMFSALWFTLFNSGPASWMESNYFHKNSNETVREQYKAIDLNLVQEHIQVILIVLGMFCGLIVFVLYVSL
jgi:hypothetical protein